MSTGSLAIVSHSDPSQTGYRKFGPSPSRDAAKTKELADFTTRIHAFYEVTNCADGTTWMRSACRKIGTPSPKLLDLVLDVDKNNFATCDLEWMKAYTSSKYGSLPKLPRGAGEIIRQSQECTSLCDVEWIVQHHYLIHMCPAGQLAGFILNYVLPGFFSRFPLGRVLGYVTQDEYESRLAVTRGLYAVAQYDFQSIIGPPFHSPFPLFDWHAVDGISLSSLIFDLLSAAQLPNVQVFKMGSPGLNLVLIADRMLSQADGGERAPDLMTFIGGRDVSPSDLEPATDVPSLTQGVIWLVDRYNELLLHLVDPCEFSTPEKTIDPISSFEYMLTFDRALRRAIAATTSRARIDRTMAWLEVADLIESLRGKWIATQTADFFKELLQKSKAVPLIEKCMDSAPQSFGQEMIASTQRTYDELTNAALASIWMRNKVQPSGVSVKNAKLTTENIELPELFTANLARSLRNSHHGYMTDQDPKGQRPSRYLALSTGELGGRSPNLAAVWVLALIANPKVMLGWDWMPVGAYL